MTDIARGFHHRMLIWALRVPKIQIYIFSRTRLSLYERHTSPSMRLFGDWGGRYDEGPCEWTFQNGAKIHLCASPEEKDVYWYAGSEMDLLAFDVPAEFEDFQFDYLRTRVRMTTDIDILLQNRLPGIILGNEPVGRWVDVLGLGHD